MSVDVQKAQRILVDKSQPMKQRIRSLFYLRNIDSSDSVAAIISALKDRSVLLKHELCYVLGQMRNISSVDCLINVLSDESEDEIVRHEAGEALGNFIETLIPRITKPQFDENFSKEFNGIGTMNSIKINLADYPFNFCDKETKNIFQKIQSALKKYSAHPIAPIRETCYIALKKLEDSLVNFEVGPSPFNSYDPAFPLKNVSIDFARNVYLNDPCIYQRYKAMFFLRNLNNPKAVGIICEGFNDSSSLFKHEVAFVLGQLRSEFCLSALHSVLRNTNEHGMVRHEAAEALGAIGSDLSVPVLEEFLNDPVDVVRESVEVALDIHEYENSLEVEYATL